VILIRRMAEAIEKLHESSTSDLCRRIVLGSNLKDVNGIHVDASC